MNRLNLIAVFGAFLLITGALRAQTVSEEAVEFFKASCKSCHSIGGGFLVGPDLRNVTQRRDRAWLTKFVRNPKAVIDSGDKVALQLLKEANNQVMQAFPDLSDDLANKLWDMIAAESALPEGKSRFAGLRISDRPFTDDDVTDGEALFVGRKRFEKGAPACNACHTVSSLGGLGGGTLGVDLTEAYARLGGRKAISNWIYAPPSPVMQPVFKNHELTSDEVFSLVAYLERATMSGENVARDRSLDFLLCGFGLAAILLVACDFIWRRRYRAVRRPLVSKKD